MFQSIHKYYTHNTNIIENISNVTANLAIVGDNCVLKLHLI